MGEHDADTTRVEAAVLDLALATQLAALAGRAYAVEAQLLGVASIPPMTETPDQILAAGRLWLTARDDGALVAAVGWEDLEDGAVDVAAVMVDPAHFRRGLATRLLDALDERRPGRRLVVMTGEANRPARNLYARRGFCLVRRVDLGVSLVTYEKAGSR